MQEKLFQVYYLFLLSCLIIGTIRYPFLDKAMRAVVILLFFTAISELTTYLLLKTGRSAIRPVVYHVSSVIEIILVTRYFLERIKPFHYDKLLVVNYCIWPVLGILNAYFLQPISRLNTNIMVIESFGIITMCLYTIYLLLKNTLTGNIFLSPHFWICTVWLIFWSCTFFFWAFIKVLYQSGWSYMELVLKLQIIMNILVYAGIAAVLFLYPKMKTIEYC